MAKKVKSTQTEMVNNSIEIFEADPFDIDALSKLFDAYRQFYRQKSDIKAAKEFLNERMKQGDSVIYIAFNEYFKAIGFTQLYPLFSSVGMKKTWLLNDLFVDPEYRGQGVSRQLISRAKELARTSQSNGIHLETEKTNSVGLNLYPSEGFELNVTSNFYFWKKD